MSFGIHHATAALLITIAALAGCGAKDEGAQATTKQAAGKEADHDDHSKEAPGSGGVLKLSDPEITAAGIKVEK